jgi:hypothetical protein
MDFLTILTILTMEGFVQIMMDPDTDPGGPKTTDPMNPDLDQQHCL